MDGPESDLYNDFKRLLLAGLKAARKQQDRIVNIVEIMRSSELGNALLCSIIYLLFNFRFAASVLQEWLLSYSQKLTQSLPYESDRAGTRPQDRPANTRFTELVVYQTL